MTNVKVCIKNEKDALAFTSIMTQYPYSADLRVGSKLIDAKSLIGVFAMAISKPAKLIINDDPVPEFFEEIRPYVIG